MKWRAFAGGDAEAPPLERTIDPFLAKPRGRIHAPPEWSSLEHGAWLGAALAVAVGAFFLGQFASLENAARRARVDAEAALASADPSVRRDNALVRVYADAAPGMRHLLTAADALDALDELGAAPARWSVTEERFEASFADMSAADLATATARLSDVSPLTQVRARREPGGRGAVISANIPRGPAGAS